MNVNFDELSEMASKQFSLEPGLSKLNETGKFSNLSVSQVNKTSKNDLEDLFHDFYDEYFDSSKIMKSSTTNVETSINEEVFHETTFLNGILKEEVYVGQPLGFVSNQYPDHVHALDKALFGMENCDTVPTPMVEQAKLKLDLVRKPVDHTNYRSMIGSLMYVTSSGPDIMVATCLWYPNDYGFDLTPYPDADHAECHLDRKTESEYVVVSSYCAHVLWMSTQLTDYGFFNDKVPIYCDSKSAIAISCNPVQHTRTKHIDV
nr:hypothetical protein [Tanacetum cinerariifolium]